MTSQETTSNGPDYSIKSTDNDIKGKSDSKGQTEIQWYGIVVACRGGKKIVFYSRWTKITVRYNKLKAVMYNSDDPRADFYQVCQDVGLIVDSTRWSEDECGVPMVECRIKEYGPV
ncbi:hypothetical protein NTE_01882 [Candidatus Nitrososphaera evergladensis SR1]|uniref:Uncharacterized protein n=1 Tax=Candidatus Nitrososphaera evergladensis SR1 TaxID=1459636 RepID=A0A075MQW5_9ARCH|nr:hypothetical protein [Candidatus Nitrososphaera evergladensis]AIF83941.1 hypothetical protein NTE_01882 [Candidatus Nitrososphaera evergladensis SR1]